MNYGLAVLSKDSGINLLKDPTNMLLVGEEAVVTRRMKVAGPFCSRVRAKFLVYVCTVQPSWFEF